MRIRLFGPFLLAAAVVAWALAPAPVSAQGMAVGVQGGINVANVDFTATESLTLSFDRRLGAVGGLFIANDFGRNIGLQVEGLFSQKGTKITAPGEMGELEMRVDYLEIPVLVRANLRGASDSVTVRLFTGPSFAMKLRDKQVFDGDELPDEDATDLKSYDMGWTLGGVVEFAKRVFVDARYTFGFVNIDDDPEDAEADVTVKTRTFTFIINVRFK